MVREAGGDSGWGCPGCLWADAWGHRVTEENGSLLWVLVVTEEVGMLVFHQRKLKHS